jgi:hypothetical protein
MKTMMCTAILLLVLMSPQLYAQGRPDSTTNRQRQSGVSPLSAPAATSARFVDENGDGIDDRTVDRGPGFQRGKDRFVDEDGDGICDTRATGLGFRRRGAGAGSMMGADGKGKMRRLGSGGKP